MFDVNTLPQNTQVLVPVHELAGLMQTLIREEVRSKHLEELEEKLLSPKEVCKLFQPSISLPTLAAWSSKGHLTKYTIDGRTWYKRSEVIAALKSPVKKYQRA